MPRIPFPKTDDMTPAQRKVYDEVVSGPRGLVVGPLLAALHRPELADRWQKFGAMLRYDTSLTPLISELAILVTARKSDCPFEWHMHEPPALAAGLPTSVIEAIKANETPVFADPDQQAVYDYVSQLHDDHAVTDTVYQQVLTRWGVVGAVELTALVGYYTMVAMTLNAHRFELPPGAKNPFAETVSA